MFPFKQVLNRQRPLFPVKPIATSDDFSICNEDRELLVPISIEDAYLESDPMVKNDVVPELEIFSNEGPVGQFDNVPAVELVPVRNEEVLVRKSTRTPHPPI